MMITKGPVAGPRMPARRAAAGPAGGGDEPDDAGTSPSLLGRIRDWDDHPAWAEFHDLYDPMLRRWCRRFALDEDATDELCQRIWIELMARMRTFRYDPSRGFRGWLWRLLQSRAIDLLRHRRAARAASFDDLAPDAPMIRPSAGRESDDDDAGRSAAPVLVRLAEEAQAAVRGRVGAETWDAYWIIAIEDRPIREAADLLGKSYTAVYTGYRRVDRMLRAEGERRLATLPS